MPAAPFQDNRDKGESMQNIRVSPTELDRRAKIAASKRKPLSLIISQLSEKLSKHGHSFVRFVDDYVNAKSRIIAHCNLHGDWQLSINKALCGRGCPKCKGSRIREHFMFSEKDATLKICQVLEEKGLEFVKWQSEYIGQKSKAVCECPAHGQWVSSFTSLWNQKTGCPACGNYGFSSNLKGYLYCLRSECGGKVKIGITNYPEKRIKQLKERTPFSFDVVEIIPFEEGIVARQMEKIFHETFVSASLTGFDGSTEWLVWTPEIQGWFRFLK